jgi:lipopolysaccharide transport system ATP-binding protein
MNAAAPANFEKRAGYNHLEHRWGNNSAQILDYLLRTPGGYDINRLNSGETLDVYVKFRFHAAVDRPIFGFTIKSTDGVVIFGVNSRDRMETPVYQACAKDEVVIVHYSVPMMLTPGDYLVSLGTSVEQQGEIVPLDRRYDSITLQVIGEHRNFGIAALPNGFERLTPTSSNS